MTNMIKIAGTKAKTLAALYNNSKPQGMGILDFNPKDMTEAEAQGYLDTGATYVDYLKGRVMKVDLKGDEFDPSLYDRDNGEGAAARAVSSIEND